MSAWGMLDAGAISPAAYNAAAPMADSHSSSCLCSSVGNEDFRDVSLETQSGQPVVLSDTDREALVMGMTLHDKAQQLLNKVCSPCSIVYQLIWDTFLGGVETVLQGGSKGLHVC